MRKINKKNSRKYKNSTMPGNESDRKRTKRTESKYKASCKDHHKNYNNEYNNDYNNDYIYGINPVKEALRGDRTINSIMVVNSANNKQIHEIIELAKEAKIIIKEVPVSKLNTVCDTKNHQNVAAYVSPMEYYSLEKLLLDDKNSDFIVALDGITDVHNLGAIIRTLEAAGFKYIMIPERRSAQLNSTVAKTSAGAIEFVRTIRVPSISNAIKELKKQGYWVLGADLKGTMNYTDADYKGKLVIVIGSEDKGISSNILKQCDFNVKIPMLGRINSLNASVSASILIYEALKARLS